MTDTDALILETLGIAIPDFIHESLMSQAATLVLCLEQQAESFKGNLYKYNGKMCKGNLGDAIDLYSRLEDQLVSFQKILTAMKHRLKDEYEVIGDEIYDEIWLT